MQPSDPTSIQVLIMKRYRGLEFSRIGYLGEVIYRWCILPCLAATVEIRYGCLPEICNVLSGAEITFSRMRAVVVDWPKPCAREPLRDPLGSAMWLFCARFPAF